MLSWLLQTIPDLSLEHEAVGTRVSTSKSEVAFPVSAQRSFGHGFGSCGSMWTQRPPFGVRQNDRTETSSSDCSRLVRFVSGVNDPRPRTDPTTGRRARVWAKEASVVWTSGSPVEKENVNMTKESNANGRGQTTSSCFVYRLFISVVQTKVFYVLIYEWGKDGAGDQQADWWNI